jgi:hypothetical protein
MSDRGDTREQPSNRDRDPGLRAEHVFLIVAAVSLSAAVAAYVLDSTLPIELNRGAYSIMVALFMGGFCGWLSRSAERRMRRVAVAELQRLATAVDDLSDQVARQRTIYLPAPGRQSGHMYVSGSSTDTTEPTQPGLDAEAIAAARRITDRLRIVDNN